MINKKDLDEVTNDSILNIIFMNKVNAISSLSKLDKQNIAHLIETRNKSYRDIQNAIENVPPCFSITRENIREKVDKHVNSIQELQYYFNEKFYKTGFIDGYKFLLEILKSEGDENTNE